MNAVKLVLKPEAFAKAAAHGPALQSNRLSRFAKRQNFSLLTQGHTSDW
jgi:hypothetical protein